MPYAYVPSENHAHTFMSADATCPENAKTLTELRCPYSWTFGRLASKRVIIQCDGDRFYLDVKAYQSLIKAEREWWRVVAVVAITALSVIIIYFIAIWLFTTYF